MLDFFNKKKKAEEKRIQAEKLAYQEKMRNQKELHTIRNLNKSNAINKKSLDVLKASISNEEIFQKEVSDFNNIVNEYQKLVDENQKLQQQLQEQKNDLTKWEEDLKNRSDAVRKDEINIHIIKESLKKDQIRVNKKDEDLNQERTDIARREEKTREDEKYYNEKSEEYKTKSNAADKKRTEYENKISDLKSREENCAKREEEIKKIQTELNAREKNISCKEKSFSKEYEKDKENWEKECAEIRTSLEEKIKEYDLKIADITSAGKTFDSLKFDKSKEGKQAKIVVKEAIRSGIKQLEDTLQQFRELDEKYASGTFKGFAVPLNEINNVNEELKVQYAAVKEHAESTGLDFGIWLSKIEDCIIEADKALKSYLFAECYKNAVEGLSYCNGYADMIIIFNNYTSGSSEESETEAETEPEENWDLFYQVFFEDCYNPETDYDSFSFQQFKKQYRKLAKKYHPDLADENKKEEFEYKTIKLNEIWEKIKARFSEQEVA